MTDPDVRALAALLQTQRADNDAEIAALPDDHQPTLADLDQGVWPHDVKAAAVAWARAEMTTVQDEPYTDDELEAFSSAIASPSGASFAHLSAILRDGLVVYRLLTASLAHDESVWHADWYATLLGNPASAARTAVRLYAVYTSYRLDQTPDFAWRTLTTLHRVLDLAAPRGTLLSDDALARVTLRGIARLVGADQIVHEEAKQARRRGLTHAGDMDDDRVGIARVGTSRPSLVVVRSVDHLPEPARNARDRRDGPRAEAEHVAAVALPLVTPPRDLVEVRECLRREYPHALAAVDASLVPVAGQTWTKIPNVLLHGPAGTGKSELAQAIGRRLGLDVDVYSCAGAFDSSFAGTSRQWSTGRFSVPLQAIIRWGNANGLVVLDEIDKAGSGSHNGSLVHALLPFLEGTTSRAIRDPYLEADVDLSAVSFIATANSLDGLSKPLLDRFTLVEVPKPGWEHLGDLATGIVERLRRERQTDDRWMPDLDPEELGVLGDWWKGGSIRALRRLVERVVDSRDSLAPRH